MLQVANQMAQEGTDVLIIKRLAVKKHIGAKKSTCARKNKVLRKRGVGGSVFTGGAVPGIISDYTGVKLTERPRQSVFIGPGEG